MSYVANLAPAIALFLFVSVAVFILTESIKSRQTPYLTRNSQPPPFV